MKNLILLLWVVLLSACSSVQKETPIDIQSIKTTAGFISGKESADHSVKVFMGIPFAAPPLGDLRWKAPQPAQPWDGVRECVTPPASAMQANPVPFFCWSKEFLIPETPISEDCLYLNVWSSAKTEQEKLPVMVWIHGGGFSGGSGTVPLYDGEAMSRKGIVFVTINYRLGIFGFMAHPELSAESELKTSGNYGILDQIAALKWVKENIASFGGNPDNVTIAGQSAGSFSVNILTVSPLAKGLFHKAIAQSGASFTRQNPLGNNLQNAEISGKELMEKIGAKSVANLRQLPADSLLKIPGRFGMTIDNIVIPPIAETFAAGKGADVPLISGWNADDGVSFGPPAKAEVFKASIKSNYGDKADKFLQLFPANSDEEAAQSQKLISQLFFGWNNYAWAKHQSQKGTNKAWLYFFTRIPPGEPNYGAFHSAEFGYALHTLKYWNRPFTDIDFNLENIMSSYWVNFAKTGNPNGKGLPEWPAFDGQQTQTIDLGNEVKAIPLPFNEQLKLMDEINN